MRAMCRIKMKNRKKTKELMDMLGLQETVGQLAEKNGMRWYGHILQRSDGHVLRN